MFLTHLEKIFSWVISFICLLSNLKDPCKQLKSMGNSCIMCRILISMLRSKLMPHLKPSKLHSLTSLWAAMFRFILRVGILRNDLQIFIYCPQTDAHPPSHFFHSFSLQTGSVRSQAPTRNVRRSFILIPLHIPSQYWIQSLTLYLCLFIPFPPEVFL